MDSLENSIMKIKADSTGTTYIFKDSFIEEQKKIVLPWKGVPFPLPNNTWVDQTIERRFRINSDKATKSDSINQEFLVTAIETYTIALDEIETYKKLDKQQDYLIRI